jgi:hypothetical protein
LGIGQRLENLDENICSLSAAQMLRCGELVTKQSTKNIVKIFEERKR